MKKLHKTQEKLLDIILMYAGHDTFPTMEELRDKLDLSSKSVVFHHLKQLEKKGYIMKGFTNRKNYIIKEAHEGEVIRIDRYEINNSLLVLPLTFLLGEKDRRMFHISKLSEKATLDHRIVPHPSQSFALEIQDSSMAPTINKKDWLVFEKHIEPKDKDIVIVEYNDKTYIRRFSKIDNSIILSSDNESIKPFIFTKKTFKNAVILGVLITLIKRSGF